VEIHNPLRSERDVFHAVVVIGAGAAAVIALALLTKPIFGAILLAVEAALGIWVLWRRAREAPTGEGGSRRSGEMGEP
jgi:hypothetical protein